ncbi:hypothetical protein Trydic_g4361 [Trypoxylus dichotomus]
MHKNLAKGCFSTAGGHLGPAKSPEVTPNKAALETDTDISFLTSAPEICTLSKISSRIGGDGSRGRSFPGPRYDYGHYGIFFKRKVDLYLLFTKLHEDPIGVFLGFHSLHGLRLSYLGTMENCVPLDFFQSERFQLSARVAAEAAPYRRFSSVQSLFNIQDERRCPGRQRRQQGAAGVHVAAVAVVSTTGNKAPPPTAQDK